MSLNEKELVGNFELTKQGVITRREVLMMGAVAATSIASVNAAVAATTAAASSSVAARGIGDGLVLPHVGAQDRLPLSQGKL